MAEPMTAGTAGLCIHNDRNNSRTAGTDHFFASGKAKTETQG